ncbi:MAG: 2,3,4,5-tetrahydropyridine-2,6-dicarboxylate N-succinyltransferase, partial [Bacteroidetes bacterium 4484_276]
MTELQKIVENAWENRKLLQEPDIKQAIEKVIFLLDSGALRVAQPDKPDQPGNSTNSSSWIVNEWIKKAVILYFPLRKMKTTELGIFEFHDKIDLKKNYKELGVRVVPHAIARYGAYLAKGVV